MGLNWKQAVKAWNHVADRTDGIFYKVRLEKYPNHVLTSFIQLAEQLSLYFSTWKTNLDIKETLSITTNARKPLQAIILDPSRAACAQTVPALPLQPHHVNRGFLPLDNRKREVVTGAGPQLPTNHHDMVERPLTLPTQSRGDGSLLAPMTQIPTSSQITPTPGPSDAPMTRELSPTSRVVTQSISRKRVATILQDTRVVKKP